MAAITIAKGNMIGRYRASVLLSRGGMGQVWLGHEEHTHARIPPRLKPRSVALKIGLDDEDEESDAALAAEGVLIGCFTHQNIPRLYEIGTHEFRPGTPSTFLAMEFIGGVSLRKLCQITHEDQLQIPFEVIATIVYEIADALLYIFDTPWGDFNPKLVHRDVSAKNVIVTRKGRVVLVDYGIAAGLRDYKNSKPPVGTLATMAPEQLLNEVTPLSDAYGTGTVLWSLIEGRAFRSGMSEAETYDMAARGEYPPLRRAGIPEVLRRACEGLLHPNPQERMTLAQLHRELERSFGRKRSELMRFIESTAGSEGWRSGMTGIHAQASSRAETPSAEGRATPSSVIGPHGTYDVPESGTSSEILHINTSSPTVRRIASESIVDIPVPRRFVRTEPYSLRLMAERIVLPTASPRTEPLPGVREGPTSSAPPDLSPAPEDRVEPRLNAVTVPSPAPAQCDDAVEPRAASVTVPSAAPHEDVVISRPSTITEPSPRPAEVESGAWIGARAQPVIPGKKVPWLRHQDHWLVAGAGMGLALGVVLLIDPPFAMTGHGGDLQSPSIAAPLGTAEPTQPIEATASALPRDRHAQRPKTPQPTPENFTVSIPPARQPPAQATPVEGPVEGPSPKFRTPKAPPPMVRVTLQSENIPFAEVKIGGRRFEVKGNALGLMVPAGWKRMYWRLDPTKPYQHAGACLVQPGHTYSVTVERDEMKMDPCHRSKGAR